MEDTTVGVNESEIAEQTEVVDTETSPSTEAVVEEGADVESASTEATAETEVQSAEDNAKYAAARRQAESEFKARIDKQNADIKRRFGQYKNPITGKPVETLDDYLEALDAQQQKQSERMLEEKGISPDVIQQMINNNPVVREAQYMKEQYEMETANAKLQEDIKAISKIDPSIKTVEDLLNSENYNQVFNYVSNNGLNIVDAYKLANSSRLAEMQAAAAKQATINSAKSKSHLETTKGVSGMANKAYAPIPSSILEKWKDAYPDLSMEQLTAKYNANL